MRIKNWSKTTPNSDFSSAPRHPERFDEVASLLHDRRIPFTRRSQFQAAIGGESDCQRVVLLDCMGELKYWWGVGNIAFVGGSFGNRGGQNMIEPLALSNAVCFGPNTRNFAQEVAGLLEYSAAGQLGDPDELQTFIEECLRNSGFRKELIENGSRYLDHHSGETPSWQLTLEAIEGLISEKRVDFEVRQDQHAA